MQTKTVSVEEAQAHLVSLLAQAAAGAEIIITRDDKPLARLLSASTSDEVRGAGLHRGKIRTSDDFDEPLPEEFWSGKE